MPKKVTTFRVFISSPSNLKSERLIIEKILAELSQELSVERDIAFEVFRWERDAVPGIGITSQTVISSQIEYDIYVGLLGTLFGTPTNSAGSGTEEEFNDACARYQLDNTSVRVLFYFNRQSSDVFAISAEQLARVREFRARIGPQGVLYHDFTGLDELRERFRAHMRALILNQWSGNAWLSPKIEKSQILTDLPTASLLGMPNDLSVGKEVESQLDEKQGWFEVVQEGLTAIHGITAQFKRMSAITTSRNAEVLKYVAVIADAKASGDAPDTRNIFDSLAGELTGLAIDLRVELIEYKSLSPSVLKW